METFRYRADFMLILQRDPPWGDQDLISKYIIEIDGHDYHERTKEQAARDKKRDRLLTLSGYKVFRFTGSEVYADERITQKEIDDLEFHRQGPFVAEQISSAIDKDVDYYLRAMGYRL